MRILIVEDENRIADFVTRGLSAAGYLVESAGSGGGALAFLEQRDFDLMILDLILPDMEGLEVLERIRNRRNAPRVLILSAKSSVEDRVRGLDVGADDYLVKPFSFSELLARVRAFERRTQQTADRLEAGDLVMDCLRRRVTRAGETIDLAPKEFTILEYLLRHRGTPVSRAAIVDHVWEASFDGLTNIVDVYIRHLRAKVDDDWEPKLIRTVRGVGYMVEAPEGPVVSHRIGS